MELKHFNEINTMRRTFFLSLALVLSLAMYQNASSKTLPTLIRIFSASWSWDETEHKFGKIPSNEPVTATFTFKNTGEEPIIITDAKGSCGCTVPSYSKEPIKKGQKGTITAKFNAAAIGVFNKTVTVFSNVGEPKVLTISGEVYSK